MSGPVRILHVLGRLDRGGAETMVMNLYRSMDKSKIQFDFVICTKDKCDYTDEIKLLGGKIYCVPRFSLKNSIAFYKAWQFFFKQHKEYKIIHGHLRSSAAIYLSIAKKHGLITIAHSHSTSSGAGVNAKIKDALQLPIRHIAHYLFACSNFAGVWLYGEKATKKDNYYILNNAIDAKNYIYNEEIRQKIRKAFNIEDRFVIGHVGRFVSIKNHEFILKVFKEIKKMHDKSILMLVGDGELKESIQKSAVLAGLKDSVIFTGVRSDVANLLQGMDLFLFPSIYEGQPVILIETQASGLPCILSDSVSRESAITDLLNFYSLDNCAQKWANKAMGYLNGFLRKNMFDQIKSAGYDIGASSKWLEEFYCKLL